MNGTFVNRAGSRVALAAMAVAMVASPAFAQEAAPQQADAQRSSGVGEIVVTAQKRLTSADKTPISISAVSGADLAARGVTSFADLAAGTPGVSMKSMGAGQTEFEMRGMASSGGNSPTVGFYLDDIPLTSPASAQNGKVVIDPTLYDLAQVEVLRGPQGTLYGSSSMGGTVKLITNKPKLDKFEASGQSTLSGTQGGGFNHAENVMVNLPVTHTMALRVVASQSTTDGWIDRVVTANGAFPVATNDGATRGNVAAAPVSKVYHNSNTINTVGVRATLLWKPTDNLTITPSFLYQRTKQDGSSTYDSDPGTNAHYQPFDIAEPTTDDIKIGGLTINYRFPTFEITSATSYWSRKSSMIQDNSENLPSVGGGFGVTTDSASYYGSTGTGPIYVSEVDPSKQFTEELRAASTGNTRLKWLVGAYFSDFRSNWQLSETVPNPDAFGSPTGNIFIVSQPTHIQQEAIFGEATYSITEKLHATVGLRGYHYQTTVDTSSAGYGEPSGNDTAILLHVVQKSTGVNPKFNLSYDVDHNTMVYATVSKGFRPGGGNQPLPSSSDPTSGFPYTMYSALRKLGYSNGQAPVSYKPDSLWSYEIGEKAKLLNRHLRVNASAYYETWSNIQLEELPAGYPLFDNANSAHIYGGEVEVQAVFDSHLSAGISAGYTHATLASTQNGFNAGDRLPDVPKWSGGANIEYHRDLDATHSFVFRVDDTYVGDRVGLASYQGNVNFTQTPLASYNLVNLRTSVASQAGWTIAFFINNLTNKRAELENAAQLGLPNASYNRVVTNQPRTFGIDLSMHL
ncbi:MAG TPA: TonB-dependent receptor [Novosphingobium sp.]|nr:TonB-dependent receptor [Novosphingobium sp.]